MSKRKKYPDGKKEYVCKYCGKLFIGGINQRSCFSYREKRNVIRARERARRIKKLNRKEVKI